MKEFPTALKRDNENELSIIKASEIVNVENLVYIRNQKKECVCII